jgi:murein L,D-transpeptidase YcbB/YkuD
MLKRVSLYFLPFCMVLFLIAGCRSCRHKKKITQRQEVYTAQKYSELVLDSTFIDRLLAQDSSAAPYADDILDFYQRRGYQSAWFSDNVLTNSAYEFYNTLQNYQQAFGDSSLIDPTIKAILGKGKQEDAFSGINPLEKPEFDFALTAAFFKYADRAYTGTTADPKDLEWFIPRYKKDYRKLLDTLVSSPASYQQYEPVNAFYRSLKKELIAYRKIQQHGGFPALNIPAALKAGDSSSAIVALKKYLAITGDYTGDGSMLYTDSLAAAARAFQGRMGLAQTGRIDSATLAEANVPIAMRIRQIMLNMERLRWVPDATPANYILVNIPEYRLHVYQDSAYLFGMDVVVGNAATATSIFMGQLSVVDFDPYWNVPNSIVRKELLPHLRLDPDYLDKLDMEAVAEGRVLDLHEINWRKYTTGVPFLIRQKPGPKNSLGLVAFFFPNSYDIYFHDTPAKSFFNESSRAFSHGCIRLSQPEKMADYIFRNTRDMDSTRIRELMDAGEEKKIAVHPAIPVFIVYFTAWVDHNGLLNFRPDVYGHDAKLAKEIFGKD